jgi:glycosyltransferase involved in cell wall biosynthesis
MKPKLLLTVYRHDWLDLAFLEMLQQHFDVLVNPVRGPSNAKPGRVSAISKKRLIADEGRYLLRLATSMNLYRQRWLFVCHGGHYATLLFARVLYAFGVHRRVFLVNFYLHKLGQSRWTQAVLRLLLTNVVGVVAQTSADVAYFRQFLREDNVLYLPYCQGPLDLGTYDGKRRNFVFAGGQTNRDHDALLRCAVSLPHINFVVVSSVRSRVTHAPPPNVALRFALTPKDFHRLMAESYVVALPLKEDVGSSGQMVALAAMQLGKVVIAPDIGAIRDYIADGITGCFYQLGNDEHLARVIACCYAAPARVDAMGFAARQRYKERFTPERFWRPLTDFILQFAGQAT